MEKKTRFIALGNQKGGVGKSALTVIYASYLHYELKKNVVIVDCDYPQHSIVNMRQTDIETVEKSGDFQLLMEKRFDRNARKAYKIIKSGPENALDTVIDYLDNSMSAVDVVLFDLPGTVNSRGVLNILINLDYIFIPIIADRRVLDSSLSFALTLDKSIKDPSIGCNLKALHFFWNRVDKRENSELYDVFSDVARDMDLPILNTRIPDTKKYNKELSLTRPGIFRSTLFPADKRLLKSSRMIELISEINSIIAL